MSHGFFKVVSTAEFVEIAKGFSPVGSERVALGEADGRVLAADVVARENLPLCDRSCMDGYAVRAQDVFGASEGNPGYLECVGSVNIETPPVFSVQPGECAAITTGGCLPDGADSVVMVEYTEPLGAETIEFRKAIAPREHVMLKGEDAAEGQVALSAGTRLRPQELGLLAALGYEEAEVGKKPCVGIISTGDELVSVGEVPMPGQVRDVNSHALGAMVERAGGVVRQYGIVRDDLDQLKTAIERGIAENDVIFLSGGSSVGTRDMTTAAIESFDDAEILVHGVSISPGKPTILARIGDTPVWGLPGQVASAQVVMFVLGGPFLAHLSGDENAFNLQSRPRIPVELSRNIAAKKGREDYVRVSLEYRADQSVLAHPRLGKSGLLKTLIEADAFIVIDANTEGLTQETSTTAWFI